MPLCRQQQQQQQQCCNAEQAGSVRERLACCFQLAHHTQITTASSATTRTHTDCHTYAYILTVSIPMAVYSSGQSTPLRNAARHSPAHHRHACI